jgi:hypothetical protein
MVHQDAHGLVKSTYWMAMFSQIGHINVVNYLTYLLCLFSYLPTYLPNIFLCPT